MFKVGDRVAVIHLHRVGKERRRETTRVDTVEKVTLKQIIEYQIVPLTPS